MTDSGSKQKKTTKKKQDNHKSRQAYNITKI